MITDEHQLLIETACLIRKGEYDKLDMEFLEDIVLSMARVDRKTVDSCMIQLLLHLLKWKYQPRKRTSSWIESVNKQRNSLEADFEDSRTLLNYAHTSFEKCYQKARKGAAKETGLNLNVFPTDCEWDFDLVMDEDFWPDN